MQQEAATESKGKNVPLEEDVHKQAKVCAAQRGLSLRDFVNDGVSQHILRLTPAEEEQAVQQQKRGSKRKAGKISK
tara:strand:- start:180 stop:407 length:228 start_codon:yes stop_codon:yes gene_type:complete